MWLFNDLLLFARLAASTNNSSYALHNLKDIKMIDNILRKRFIFPLFFPFEGKKNRVNPGLVRQLDIALMNVGFKLSPDLTKYLISLNSFDCSSAANSILEATKKLVGDHVRHNVYFKEFPKNVPDTFEFWWGQLISLFFTGDCTYGTVQHTYEEMLEAQEEFAEIFKRKAKVINLGSSLQEETFNLYKDLAGSSIPLNPEDRTLLEELLQAIKDDDNLRNVKVGVRENKAIINTFMVNNNRPVINMDTVTDVLRLAANLSGGDVTLQEKVKFKTFPRKIRRALLYALDQIPSSKYEDLFLYQEQWKRLGERLHPHEFHYYNAQIFFSNVRGETKLQKWSGQVEEAIQNGDNNTAVDLLAVKPGYLIKNVDRLVRTSNEKEYKYFKTNFKKLLDKVSMRNLLSLRQHLISRNNAESRIFINKSGKGFAIQNKLEKIDQPKIVDICSIIDRSLVNRLPNEELLISNNVLPTFAIPLSEKNKSEGFDVLPRGSVIELDPKMEIVRFFVYWHQNSQRTDYDLSLQFYDKNFNATGQVSWTSLRNSFAIHSGNITNGTHGSSEFLDIDINQLPPNVYYFVPTVNVFSGEKFDEVKECFFGYMARSKYEKGAPFEPKTVKTKFALRGKGQICMPLAFFREGDAIKVKWLDLYSKGRNRCNMVENNKFTTALVAKTILNKEYLNIDYLLNLYKKAGSEIKFTDEHDEKLITISRLNTLIK